MVKNENINLKKYVKKGEEYSQMEKIVSKEKNGLNLIDVIILPREGAGNKGCIESKDENGDISMNNNSSEEIIFSIVTSDGIEIDEIEHLKDEKASIKIILGARFWTK